MVCVCGIFVSSSFLYIGQPIEGILVLFLIGMG